MSLFDKIDRRITSHSNLILLIFVFIFIFIIPFFPVEKQQILGNVFFSLIFFSAIFTLNTNRKAMFTIAVIAFLTEWISELINMPILNYLSLIVNILFFQIIVIKLIIQIAKSKKADASTILEAINVYLLMGLMFTSWVAIAMLFDPGAFSFTIENPNTREYTYFTFVTMTTLGYGDVLPIHSWAKSMAILFSSSGQIYLAVIIAMLVGKYAGSQKD